MSEHLPTNYLLLKTRKSGRAWRVALAVGVVLVIAGMLAALALTR